MKRLVAPSMLAADFSNLGAAIQLINQSEADWFHLDVMDGMFVPNITFGMPVIKQLKKQASKPFDVHLMIEQPERYVKAFHDAGADILTVHYEACTHLHRTVKQIQDMGMQAGVALNPHTPVSSLSSIIQELDLVLIMSVNPGFGGQSFIKHTYEKIRQTAALIEASGSAAIIEVDGGVSDKNAPQLYEAGATVLVAGSYVFGAANPLAAIEAIK